VGKEISRRDFLRIFPGLAAKRAGEMKENFDEVTGRTGRKKKRKAPPAPTGEPVIPAFGAIVEGIPNLHPWIAAAHGIAAFLGRPRTYSWLLGTTGEAFTTAYSRENTRAALHHTPGNTFLAALAVCGILGRAAHGGPFEPAIGGIAVALDGGAVPVIATRQGPVVIRSVEKEDRTADWIRPGEKRVTATFDELEEQWREAWWPGGSAAYIRVNLERAEERPAERISVPAIDAMVMLVTQTAKEPYAMGGAAWEAFAEDLRENRLAGETADAVLGELLPKIAVARLAAGGFFEEVAAATPKDRREAVEDARRIFREIHAPSPAGETFGTGLLPEAAQCLTEDQLPDHGKLEDAAFRERAADLFLEIRDREKEAAERVRDALPR
jgi:hypothetical protein